MKKHLDLINPSFVIRWAVHLPILWALVGCVSVQLGGSPSIRAKGLDFQPPPHPFERFTTAPNVDSAWKNPKNGNTISYLSECEDRTDPPLEQIQRGVLSGLKNPKFITNESTMYNGRQALHTLVVGSVDGISTQVESMIFKKNNCIYILTYVGIETIFGQDQHYFSAFLKGFRAP